MTLKEIVASHTLFAGLSDNMIATIAECASQAHFNKGVFLFHEGEASETFYLIDKGDIALQSHAPAQEAILQTVGPGSVVGVSWLSPPHKLHYDAKALSDVDALAFDTQKLISAFEEDHELGYQVMKRLAAVLVHRLHATRFQMIDVYSA